jgi:drug/metabolite transporter (DMT)-like permease
VWGDLILRCVFGTIGIFANFYALTHIPVGNAMALNRTAPFFTLLMGWILLGQRMTLRQMLCVAGAFAGAMFVIKPGGGMLSGHALIGLFGGFGAGAAYAFLHKLGKAGIDGAFIIFFFSVFSCVACVPFLVCGFVPMSLLQIGVLLAAGACAALGQFGITWGYRFAEPRQVAVYDYAGIIFAALLGFLAFGQIPDFLSLIGFAVIIVMGLVLHFRPTHRDR